MTVREMIDQLHRLATLNDAGLDSEVTLFDRADDRTIVTRPDEDVWGFEILRGENELVIEFN